MSPDSKVKLMAQIQPEEGVVLHAYQDSLGYWTIGIGRLIDARKGGGISMEEALYLFQNDVDKRLTELAQYQWFVNQDDVRQAALADMDFNTDLLHFPHFLAHMLDKDYAGAVAQLTGTPWEKEIGSRATRLEQMILTGEWP